MKRFILTLLFIGLDLGQIQAQTIYRGDTLYTYLILPNDSTVKAFIEVNSYHDSSMFKWFLGQTSFGDSIYFHGPVSIVKLDSLMLFELNYFNEMNNTKVLFK